MAQTCPANANFFSKLGPVKTAVLNEILNKELKIDHEVNLSYDFFLSQNSDRLLNHATKPLCIL